MSGFSNFLTNFSGGSRNSNSDMDLMSTAIIVPSFNTNLNHVSDGFIYLSNLLIQFSATSNMTILTKDNNYNCYYPINYQPLCVQVSPIFNGSNSSNVCFQNLTTNDYFLIRITGNNGNLNWISISLAPTTPIYTLIRNKNFTSNSLSSICINQKGNNQYACNGNDIFINNNYGYGGWSTQTHGSLNASNITCDYSGQNIGICGSSNVIYLSSDYGGNWAQKSLPSSGITVNALYFITCSGDGTKFYVAAQITNNIQQTFYLYNGKSSFTNATMANIDIPTCIATNNTGQYVYISGNAGVSVSKNSGVSTILTRINNSLSFGGVTTDSTGQYVATFVNNGYIYISSNYGSNFSQSNSPSALWSSITMNGTGKYLSAATGDASDGIYYSTDYGMSWTKTGAPNNIYVGINMNSNGNIATAITSSSVYVSFNASN